MWHSALQTASHGPHHLAPCSNLGSDPVHLPLFPVRQKVLVLLEASCRAQAALRHAGSGGECPLRKAPADQQASRSAAPLCPAAWLLLQAPRWVFQEGEPIRLRCHSWNGVRVVKVQYFQDGRGRKYFYRNTEFHIPKATREHGGAYFCRGIIGILNVSSEAVNITVLGERGAGLRGPEPHTWGVSPHAGLGGTAA